MPMLSSPENESLSVTGMKKRSFYGSEKNDHDFLIGLTLSLSSVFILFFYCTSIFLFVCPALVHVGLLCRRLTPLPSGVLCPGSESKQVHCDDGIGYLLTTTKMDPH